MPDASVDVSVPDVDAKLPEVSGELSAPAFDAKIPSVDVSGKSCFRADGNRFPAGMLPLIWVNISDRVVWGIIPARPSGPCMGNVPPLFARADVFLFVVWMTESFVWHPLVPGTLFVQNNR